MPKPRSSLVSLEATPYYHCVSRCVRRAFLCGTDTYSGQCFEHRREWIKSRLFQLVEVFSIDLCGYAIMSNHYHLVLHVDSAKAINWSNLEVIERWHRLFKGTPLTHRYLMGHPLGEAEALAVKEKVKLWRSRLMDISWLMRVLNEAIAREANQEDRCTGRFWEGRFKSQALLDEKALAACLVYVDLNPIRAQMADSPETSEFTSVHERIDHAKNSGIPNRINQQPSHLMPFAGNPRQDIPKGLPFRLTDYLDLVDWTGRIIREDKRGAISENLPPIMDRLDIDPKHWLYMTRNFESGFKGLVGSVFALKQACEKLNYQRLTGLSSSLKYLS